MSDWHTMSIKVTSHHFYGLYQRSWTYKTFFFSVHVSQYEHGWDLSIVPRFGERFSFSIPTEKDIQLFGAKFKENDR